ncbi:MAG: alpha/beta hydrolase, partial [Candidatus Moranbacteria bacterium]|nr:alpha/beta hydrolase [Candidatus Moranbacteria bacterium]
MREGKFMYEERLEYLAGFIRQLDRRRPCESNKYPLKIDFRVFSGIPPLHGAAPVLLATGWGSGWEGIAPLAFSFACEGFDVVLLSFPGYGNSENPPPNFYKFGGLYRNCAVAATNILKTAGFSKAYFVGHSMGAEILAKAAAICPRASEKLVLMNPSGVRPVSGFWAKAALAWRFAASGAKLRREYHRSKRSKDDYLKPLIDMCGQQKSPWGWGRRRQRWAEFKELCKGQLPKILENVTCPVVFFSGDRDTVYPAYES